MSISSYKVKCLVMGDSHIDTWNLLSEHIQSSFANRYKYTIGLDIGVVDVRLPYERVTISIWDLACSDRYRFFRPSFFRGASCAILAFDLTRYTTFNPGLLNYITEIYSTLGAIPIILLGCNADRDELRTVRREDIDQLCQKMAHAVYFELNFNDAQIMSVFETVAELILRGMGLSEEDRRIAYEWKKQRLEALYSTLEEMNFQVSDHDEVEIITSRGIFSINILSSAVHFEPLICSECDVETCRYKTRPRKKSLCIVAGGTGWSNQELQNHELLVLAKILAIAEDRLPTHVLNQMREIEHCGEFSRPTDEIPNPFIHDLPAEEVEPVEYQPPEPASTYTVKPLCTSVTAFEARTLLRNYRLLFQQGRLPYSVFTYYKERFDKIINA